MTRSRRHILTWLAALLAIASLSCAVWAHDGLATGQFGDPIAVSALGKAAIGVKTQVIEKKSIPMEITVPGKIEVIPSHQFDEHAPLSGRISSVSVSLGQMVKEGQVLAVIESPEMNQLAAQLLQSRLDIESEIARQKGALNEEVRQAEERYTLADANYKRVAKLHDLKIAAQKDVIAAQTEFNLAARRVKTAKANREIILKTLTAKVDLTLAPLRQRLKMLGVDESEIQSMIKQQKTLTQVPVEAARSGFLTAVAATPGKSIDPSVSLFTIADLTKVWATAQVYEDEMSRMRTGQHVHVKIHALQGEHVDGVLTFIGTQVDPLTRTLPVRAELENSDFRLKPDMYADLYIETSDSNPTIAVPRDAVIQQAGRTIAFIETEQGYQPVYVKTGRTIGDTVEILSGLEVGQKLVAQGAFQLGAELLKNSGGAAMFAQATEGERLDQDEENDKKPAANAMSFQGIIVLVIGAFLFGVALSGIFLFRNKNGRSVREELALPDTTPVVSKGSSEKPVKTDHV